MEGERRRLEEEGEVGGWVRGVRRGESVAESDHSFPRLIGWLVTQAAKAEHAHALQQQQHAAQQLLQAKTAAEEAGAEAGRALEEAVREREEAMGRISEQEWAMQVGRQADEAQVGAVLFFCVG